MLCVFEHYPLDFALIFSSFALYVLFLTAIFSSFAFNRAVLHVSYIFFYLKFMPMYGTYCKIQCVQCYCKSFM